MRAQAVEAKDFEGSFGWKKLNSLVSANEITQEVMQDF